jgi:hypothetical protein
MLNRICWLLLVTCLVIGTSWAADNPFVGKWRVNPSKSKLTDEMKVEVVGENKYAFTFGPGAVDTIVADGTDQPACRAPHCPLRWRDRTTGRSSARRRAARSSWRIGRSRRTAKRSMTTSQLTSPTVHQQRCTLPTSDPRRAQVFRPLGIARAQRWTRASSSRSSRTGVTPFHLAVPRCNSIGKPSSMGRIMGAPVRMCRLALHLLAVV